MFIFRLTSVSKITKSLITNRLVGKGFFFNAPSFIHQHRSHCNIRSCILTLLLKQLVCKKTLPNFLILFFMLFSPSRLGRETSRLSFPPHFPLKPRKRSREDTLLFKENWFCWEFHAVGWNISTDSWKWLTCSRALVHQLPGQFWAEVAPKRGAGGRGGLHSPAPAQLLSDNPSLRSAPVPEVWRMAVTRVPAALWLCSSVRRGTRLQVTVLPAGHKFCPQRPAGLNQVQEKKKKTQRSCTTSYSKTPRLGMPTCLDDK